MSHKILIRQGLEAEFKKIAKKDPSLFSALSNKIAEVAENPYRYKRLRSPFKGMYRVHVKKHFVLVYSVDGCCVVLERFRHHDNVYL